MERVCFTFSIFEGQEAEYKKRHDEIWPELVDVIKAAGMQNYSLFRRGTEIIAYVESASLMRQPALQRSATPNTTPGGLSGSPTSL